jgi:transcriptional regulator of NAD metabolism
MMSIIKDRLIKFVNKSGNLINKSKIKDENETKNLLSKMHDANLALLSIKLGKIHSEVLKQIAPYFNLSIDNIGDELETSSDESNE